MAYVEGEMPINVGTPCYNNGGMFGNGMDGLWGLIALAIVFGNFGGNGFGWGGNNGNRGFGVDNMMYDINANTNRGFDQLAVTTGINDLQTAIATGFANADVNRCNQTTALLQSINSLAMGQQNCCCQTRESIADLKYTVATENCADRQAVQMGVRDIIESNNRNTQSILDKLCQQELDAKNDLISTLRSQLSMADLRASQTAQTAQIREGQVATLNSLVNELRSCPIPAQPVYGSQPIFTCPNSNGCGCNGQSIQ